MAINPWEEQWGDASVNNLGRLDTNPGTLAASKANPYLFRIGTDLAQAQDISSRFGGTLNRGYGSGNSIWEGGVANNGGEIDALKGFDPYQSMNGGHGYYVQFPDFNAARDAGYASDPSFMDKYGLQIALALGTAGIGAGMTGALPGTTAIGAGAAGAGGGLAGGAGTMGPGGAFAGGAGTLGPGGAFTGGGGGSAGSTFSSLTQGSGASNSLLSSLGLTGDTGKLVTGLAGGLLGGTSGSGSSGSSTATTTQKMDPRMDNIVYGANGNDGFLSKVMGELGTSQNPGINTMGQQTDGWLGNYGLGQLHQGVTAANQLQTSNINSPQINAPSQNSLDLKGAYNDMINGAPGNNPYLTGAIQKGINQSNNAFGDYMTDANKGFGEAMSNIRGGAIVNGSMGSSRQGIAEGKAVDSYMTNMTRAMERFGQNNTDAAVSAQAGAYDQDRSRSLNAMQGLGGQQYGLATNNAQLQHGTNALNSANQIAGINANSGLLNQMYGIGQNQDAYNLNKMGKVGGLLGNFTGLNNSTSQTQPLYENKGAGILGGISTGLGLWNMFNK